MAVPNIEVAMAELSAPQRLPTAPCLNCQSNENVIRLQTPEFPHIRCYQCVKCGHGWATNLEGKPVLIGVIDEL
jgi:hypothetical protein